MWKFEMYVIGDNRRSMLAVENLRDICNKYLDGQFHVTVIDLKQHPGKMAESKICVAPTLIKKSPGPERMLVGDLSKTDLVLQGLDIDIRDRRKARNLYVHGLSRQGLPSKWSHLRNGH